MKSHSSIIILILTTMALLATGCKKEPIEQLGYPQLVDGATFNMIIPKDARAVVFEYNNHYRGTTLLSTPNSSDPIYCYSDSNNVWHVTTPASTIYATPHCDKMFYNLPSLAYIVFGSEFNTSNVVRMDAMFRGCSGLTSLDLSNFNTSNVKRMDAMFYGCRGLTSLDLSNFNTSNVERMDAMFYGCHGLTSLNVSSFNTSNVVMMTRIVDSVTRYDDYAYYPGYQYPAQNDLFRFGMFAHCSSLKSLDLSSFNTSKVTDMRGLFEGCKKLRKLNVSSFNTSNVRLMDAMFKDCSNLVHLDVSNFNTSNVVSMGSVFYFIARSGSAGQYRWDHEETVGGMFENCTNLVSLDLSNFNTSNVARMYNMFRGCKHLIHINLSGFDLSQLEKGVFDYYTEHYGSDNMCYKLSTTAGYCTIVCSQQVQNILLVDSVTYIPTDKVTFTWKRP